MRSRSEATRPVSRPREIRAPASDPSPWTPPPTTQRAVTTSTDNQASAPAASRHQACSAFAAAGCERRPVAPVGPVTGPCPSASGPTVTHGAALMQGVFDAQL